ncbi:MAG: hypothetical protein WCD80_10370 [Desulfobaccales bacterium]|jgi:hypothetical protein
MAKKKQLAGKTTKLAKLPLTLALAEQSEDAVRSVPAAVPAHGGAEPLGAVYLHVIRELTSLLAHLQPDPEGLGRPFQVFLPPQIPQPSQIRQSLRLAQQGLLELHLLLSS